MTLSYPRRAVHDAPDERGRDVEAEGAGGRL